MTANQTNLAKTTQIDEKSYQEVIDYEPNSGVSLFSVIFQTKLDYFNKQGWGYSDSAFVLKKAKKPVVSFSGNRYLYAGQVMPEFYDWVMKAVGINIDNPQPAQNDMEIDPPQNVSHAFLEELETAKAFSRRSFEKWERIMHSHGASLREVFALRFGRFERYVDTVVYPGTNEHV